MIGPEIRPQPDERGEIVTFVQKSGQNVTVLLKTTYPPQFDGTGTLLVKNVGITVQWFRASIVNENDRNHNRLSRVPGKKGRGACLKNRIV